MQPLLPPLPQVEPGLVRYLLALSGLAGSEQLRCVRARTRIRLQSELYVLSLPGGPRWVGGVWVCGGGGSLC
jgi:hypothetical protein